MRIMSDVKQFWPLKALNFGPKWDRTQEEDERGWNEHEALRGIKTDGSCCHRVSRVIVGWNEHEALRGIKTSFLLVD